MAMNWLSITDISKITRIPAPTARRYASLFKEYLGGRKMGRVTKYPEPSVQLFQRIVTMYNDGLVTPEIEDRLRDEAVRTIEIEPRQDSAPAARGSAGFESDLAVTVTRLMNSFGQCLEIIADQKSILQAQRHEIQRLKSAFVLLARSHKRVKEIPARMIQPLAEENRQRTLELAQRDQELEALAESLVDDTTDLKGKMSILEGELVRLRKDRREMERFILDRIQSVKESLSK